MVAVNAVVALCGAGIAAGLLLVIEGFRPTGYGIGQRRTRLASWIRSPERWSRAIGGGFILLVLTRWPVAGIAGAILGWASPDLYGGTKQRQAGISRTEAIATWTEMWRDTIGAAHGLESAITATAATTPEPIRAEVQAMSADLQREPITIALQRFATRLAHPISDLVVAALATAANGSVRDLAELLGTLAGSARDEASMQLRVEAGRARMRTAVRVITAVTVLTVVGLTLLNPRYVRGYGTPVGQVVLALIAMVWGGSLWWLQTMARFRSPERFLLSTATGEVGS